jgi:PTH1 family peptidyl-tRNA hydrolase
MWLIAGLGNPGKEYALNRHNVGFMVADVIADHYNFPDWKKKFNGLMSQGEINGEKVLLLKPTTFMNVSGSSVGAAAQFFKISSEKTIVVYDELDLDPGKIRVKQNGGSGGHNGIKSIDTAIDKNYWRIRLGIGHPGDKDRVSGYVLSNFAKSEMQWLPNFLGSISDHIDEMLGGDPATFMNKVTLDMSGE